MSWLLIVIIAHFFYAGVFVLDRYLIKKEFSSPLTYAFYTGVLGVFVFLLAPFGLKIPSSSQLLFSFAAGIIWILAAIFFYTALLKGESSRVVPTVGALIPIFTLILSFIFLNEKLGTREIVSFCFLVSGGLLISLKIKRIVLIKAFSPTLGAALAFAAYFVMTKFVFLNQNFVSGLIWIRLGAALGVLFLLIPSSCRRRIFKKTETIKKKTIGFFSLARGLGIIAGLLIYWAIFLGSVTLVNAIQGVQYIFVLLLAFLLFKKLPALKEHFEKRILIQKIFAIILIGIGLVILVI